MAAADYEAFLASKARHVIASGFDADAEHPGLFPFQRAIVRWALRRGRAAVFASTGLGKSRMQLLWASRVAEHTRGRVLILAPLAVTKQTEREAATIGIEAKALREDDGTSKIAIANYEMLEHFDGRAFAGIVLDESSIMKDIQSKTRAALFDAFARTPYRLCCTATPAPNDFTELGQHAQFLGVMTRQEMLSRFFVHDGGSTQDWRIKGHARQAFWEWICEWACVVRHPADLGFADARYDLPELKIIQHVVKTTERPKGMLFHGFNGLDLNARRGLRRESVSEKVAMIADLVNPNTDAWLIWCGLNAEADACEAAIPSAVQLSGTDSREWKEAVLLWFAGQTCLCENGHNKQWQTPHISENTTGKTAPGDLPKTRNTACSTQTKSEPISENTTKQISGATPRGAGRKRSATTTTQKGGIGIRPTPQCRPDTEPMRKPGPLPIQEGASAKCSSDTASPLKTTSGSLPGSRVDAQSVPKLSPMDGSTDCMSTTATPPESSVGSCAETATWGSESSETIQTESSEPPCICGHTSGRRVLVTKASMFGHGMNWQSCHRMVFCGLSDSAEQFYQAVRRCWRFGQKHPVEVHVVMSEPELAVLDNVEQKQARMREMGDAVVKLTKAKVVEALGLAAFSMTSDIYEPKKAITIPPWLRATS